MTKQLKIGIVGCGAIGTSLAKSIQKDFKGKAALSGLFDIDENKSAKLAVLIRNKKLVAVSLSSLIRKSDLIIEATHARSAYDIIKKALLAQRDVLIMSVGGIIDKYDDLVTIAKKKNRHVYIPSGAVCGIDGLKAASNVKIQKVILTTRKPPKGLGLAGLKKDKLLFDGSAKEAVKIFPQNINVAATLSIAGIGPKKTRVRIIASPKIKRNIHELEVISDAGRIFTRTENIAHPNNPKTSFLAVLSALQTLRQIIAFVKVGT